MPPLTGARWRECWARYPWITSNEPSSRSMGNVTLKTASVAFKCARVALSTFDMVAARSKKMSTACKKFGSSSDEDAEEVEEKRAKLDKH